VKSGGCTYTGADWKAYTCFGVAASGKVSRNSEHISKKRKPGNS